MIIQTLLLAAFALVALAAVRLGPSPRHLALRRVFALGSLGAAGLAVLFPEVVTEVANAVGVGRGTDLVLYVFVVLSAVVWLSSYRRLAELDARITELVRRQALERGAAELGAAPEPGQRG